MSEKLMGVHFHAWIYEEDAGVEHNKMGAGLSWCQGMIDIQKENPNWRPTQYYTELASCYGSGYENIGCWDMCENLGWENALRKIIIGFYNHTETEYTYLWKVANFNEHMEIIEVLKCDDDDESEENCVLMVPADCGWLLGELIDSDNLPAEAANSIRTDSHKHLCKDLSNKADKHWIAEMYALLVCSKDSGRCNMVPWKFQFDTETELVEVENLDCNICDRLDAIATGGFLNIGNCLTIVRKSDNLII